MNSTYTKTILFPTDFSLDSMNAIDFAIDICKKNNSRLVLLNVIDAPFSYMTEDDDSEMDLITSDLMYISNLNLGKIKTKIEDIHAISVCFTTYVGDMAIAVSRAIENFNANKVIMGTKIIDDLFFKSNTYEILKTISKPLLSISINCKNNGYNKVLLAVNTTFNFDKISEVLEFASIYNSKVIVYIISTNAIIIAQLNELKNYFTKHNIDCETITVASEDFANEILDYCKQTPIDLISVVDTLPDISKQDLKLNHIKNLVDKSTIPVLTIPARN
jgi:nucleotide-binding universal stress UspA family protein